MREAAPPGAGEREALSPLRVLTAVLGWPALAFFLLRAPAPAFVTVVLVVGGLAAWEFLGLSGLAGSRRASVAFLVLGVCAAPALGGPGLFVAALATASLILGTSALFLTRRELQDTVGGVNAAAAGMLYVGMPLGLLFLLRGGPEGVPLVALLVLGTWARDMGAFLGGRFLRGRPLRADLNPRKHLPGALSGLVVATLAVMGLDRLQGGILDGVEVAALSLAIGVFGQVGDLFESLLKRRAGARHSGRVLAEQGGALDSIDGLLFTAPATFVLLHAVRSLLARG